jgi:hypothetical protein
MGVALLVGAGQARADVLVFTNLNIDLAPGTYWISAWVDRPFAGGGQWFWDETTPVTGSEFFIHNPGGGFGFGTSPVPGSVVTGPPPHDLAFEIDGTLTSEGVPEPGSVLLLSLGAIGLAGYGWRRRTRVA